MNKPTRSQRAWQRWLDLPAAVRIAAVILALAIVLLLWPSTARATERVVVSGGNELRLLDAPCRSAAVRALLNDEWRDKFKAAHADLNGRIYAACWIDTGQGAIFVAFDDGDMQLFPIAIFRNSGA